MNRSVLPPFHYITDAGTEVWLFHFAWNENAGFCSSGLGFLELLLLSIEAFFNVIAIAHTLFIVHKAFSFPPVHMNLVILTNSGMISVAFCCLGRIGQIMYQTGILGENDLLSVRTISTTLLIFSHIRLAGGIPVIMYGIVVYIERCLALRFVRDYERERRLYIGVAFIIIGIIFSNSLAWLLTNGYLPGYPSFLISILPHTVCFFLIKRLLIENEKRLERLNSRDIRRPMILSKSGRTPRKFFGESTKDMYTLSLRLQLDENIWCCKQLSRGNYVFLFELAFLMSVFGIPPLFSYSENTLWILNTFVTIANLIIPIGTVIVQLIISWSLDKLRPNVFPAGMINYVTNRREVAPVVEENKLDVETNHYFDQLANQWERAFPN